MLNFAFYIWTNFVFFLQNENRCLVKYVIWIGESHKQREQINRWTDRGIKKPQSHWHLFAFFFNSNMCLWKVTKRNLHNKKMKNHFMVNTVLLSFAFESIRHFYVFWNKWLLWRLKEKVLKGWLGSRPTLFA
jgi:hypothetical protein